jgi:hypothetical protein
MGLLVGLRCGPGGLRDIFEVRRNNRRCLTLNLTRAVAPTSLFEE